MTPHYYLAQSHIKLALVEPPIGRGGEGAVYRTSQAGWVAKVYHRDKMYPDTFAKLDIMIRNPPDEAHKHKNKPSLAWPASVLLDSSNKPCGFVMLGIDQGIELHHIYNPVLRKKHAPQFTWYHLLHTAQNLCSIVQSIHQKGYVIGDAKQSNILIRPDTTVALIDTDSFQVISPDGKKIYHCKVATPKLCPPELLGINLAQVRRDVSSDLYTLAVILHQLIFGLDPIPNRGKWQGSGDDFPPIEECVRNNYWIHAPNLMIVPSEQSLTLDILPQGLAGLFLRAFNEGYIQPTRRPSAEDWRLQLEAALDAIDICRYNDHHLYFSERGDCPWCKRKQRFRSDYFPAPENSSKRFDPSELYGRKIDRLIASGKERQAIQYWDDYKVADHRRYRHKSNQIESLRTALAKWDQFKWAFVDPNTTEGELLRRWDAISHMEKSRTVQQEIGELPGNLNTKTLRAYLQRAEVARAAIEQIINTQKQHDLYRKNKDDELSKVWEALAADIRQRSWFQYQGQAYYQQAQERLNKVRMLDAACVDEDEQKVSDIWNRHKTVLSRIDIIAKNCNDYEKLSQDMQVLGRLCDLARHNRRDYCAIQQLWRANPGLQGRTAVRKKPSWPTQAGTIKDFVETEAKDKCDILQQLKKLKESVTDQKNSLAFYEAWFAAWQKHARIMQKDPAFAPYWKITKKAEQYIKRWQLILAAIEQKNGSELITLWHEPKDNDLYKLQLGSRALIDKATALIEQALPQLESLGSVETEIGHMHITLSWHWPKNSSIDGVKIHVEHADSAIEEFSFSKKQFWQYSGKIILPLKTPWVRNAGTALNVSIHPYVTFLSQSFSAKTAAVHLDLANPPRFLYQWYPNRQNPSAIILRSNRDYLYCLIQLMGNDYRMPLPTDPDNIKLWTWPPLKDCIQMNRSVKISIPHDIYLTRFLQLWAYSDAAATQPITLQESTTDIQK